LKTVVVLAEAFHLIHVGCADQHPIEPVGPGVIGTLESTCKLACLVATKLRTTMPTDIEEGSHFSLAVAYDHDTFVVDLDLEELTWVCDLRNMPGK
jgi:hypothetical protein